MRVYDEILKPILATVCLQLLGGGFWSRSCLLLRLFVSLDASAELLPAGDVAHSAGPTFLSWQAVNHDALTNIAIYRSYPSAS